MHRNVEKCKTTTYTNIDDERRLQVMEKGQNIFVI